MGPKAEPTEPATALWQANVLPAYACRAVPPAGDFVPRKMRWNLGVSGVNRKIRCLEEAQGEAKEAAYARKRGRIPTKLHEFCLQRRCHTHFLWPVARKLWFGCEGPRLEERRHALAAWAQEGSNQIKPVDTPAVELLCVSQLFKTDFCWFFLFGPLLVKSLKG